MLRHNEEQPVGTSKRYAARIDARMSEKIDQVVMRDSTPETLTELELQLSVEPLTRTPNPMPVYAWVRYGATGMRVKARAVAWTAKAVAVEWQAPNGLHRAWVWSSAVEPRQIE
jgi:hypothetical protein